MFARICTAAAALTLAGAPAVLYATSADYEPVTITVQVDDLDPAKPADRAKFDVRLKSAARSACRTGIDSRWARAEEHRCVEEMIANGASWAN